MVIPSERRRELMGVKRQQLTSFCSELLHLIDLAINKSNDENLQAVREQFLVIRGLEPSTIIHGAGPCIWKYRHELVKRDDDFFLNSSFTDDVGTFYGDGDEHFDQSEVDVIMNSIKGIWKQLTPAEHTLVWGSANTLLSHYAQYLKADTQINRLG